MAVSRTWRQRFIANRERVRMIYDERFCRMWPAEASFRWQDLVVFQIQLAPRNDTLPMTRGYIGKREKALALHEAAHREAAPEPVNPRRKRKLAE